MSARLSRMCDRAVLLGKVIEPDGMAEGKFLRLHQRLLKEIQVYAQRFKSVVVEKLLIEHIAFLADCPTFGLERSI